MKTRFTLALVLLALVTSTLTAQIRRTIVVKDGKVIEDGRVVENLLEAGGKRPFLGVVLNDITPELREYFGGSKDSGILVASVEDNSPADKAGIRVGDVIVAVEGKDVDSAWDLRGTLRGKKEGDAVRIDILRGRNRQTVVANVVEREMPAMRLMDLGKLGERLGDTFNNSEWHARLDKMQNCDELQAKLHELESRLRDLEKKLQK